MDINNSAEMKLVWEWQFIEAGTLKLISHPLVLDEMLCFQGHFCSSCLVV